MASWQIGDVKVTRVLEQEAPLQPEALITNIDADRLAGHLDWLKPHFMNEAGEILLSIHALVVESAGKTIVAVDAVGAGVGDVVMFAAGSSARQTEVTKERPVDATVMAIVDLVEEDGEYVYRKDQDD